MMKVTELRQKNVADLQSLKLELLREQFNLRMQQGSQQLAKSHLLKQARHNIARINTIMNEKTGEAQS